MYEADQRRTKVIMPAGLGSVVRLAYRHFVCHFVCQLRQFHWISADLKPQVESTKYRLISTVRISSDLSQTQRKPQFQIQVLVLARE